LVKYFTNVIIIEDGGAVITDIKGRNVLVAIMDIYIIKGK